MEQGLREVLGNQLMPKSHFPLPVLLSLYIIHYYYFLNLCSAFFNKRPNLIAYFWPFFKLFTDL